MIANAQPSLTYVHSYYLTSFLILTFILFPLVKLFRAHQIHTHRLKETSLFSAHFTFLRVGSLTFPNEVPSSSLFFCFFSREVLRVNFLFFLLIFTYIYVMRYTAVFFPSLKTEERLFFILRSRLLFHWTVPSFLHL